MDASFKTIEEYILSFPLDTQVMLRQVWKVIKSVAPDAEESIGYGMPAFKTANRPLVYFAAFKTHIGFYATPTGHKEFADELSAYKQGKGSVQFPMDKPLPLDLIERITRFRVMENQQKSKK